MPQPPSKTEITDLWDELWTLRCQLDEQMQSAEATMVDIKRTIIRASKVCMTLKASLDARDEPNEELLKDVRDACDFQKET